MGRFERKTQQMQERIVQAEMDFSLVKTGWTPYKPNASDDEQIAAIKALGTKSNIDWYPPGYTEEPIISEGKLTVPPEPVEEERPWWKFW